MIDTAARATRGVQIPNRKATRAYIIKLFKNNLTNLRNRIKVCDLLLDEGCNSLSLDCYDWTCVLNLRRVAGK